MKPWFKNLEMIIVSVCAIGMGLKLAHIEPADTILLIALLTLAFLYMFMGIASNNATFNAISPLDPSIDVNRLESLFILSSGVSMAIAIVGVLFHLLAFEGSSMQLMVGSISCIFELLICYVFIRPSQPQVHEFLFYRLLPVAFMSGVLFYIESKGG